MIVPGDEFYLHAWFELDTCRQIGMDVGLIPWDKIVIYGEFHELEKDMLLSFVQIIRQMDAAYLKRKEQKRQIEKSTSRPTKKRR